MNNFQVAVIFVVAVLIIEGMIEPIQGILRAWREKQ